MEWRGAAVGIGATLALVSAAPAHGAGFTPPQDLGDGAMNVAVAGEAGGAVTASIVGAGVATAVRRPGEEPGRGVAFATPDRTLDGPRVDAGPGGRVGVAFLSSDEDDAEQIDFAFGDLDAGVRQRITYAPGGAAGQAGINAADPAVAFGADGRALGAWGARGALRLVLRGADESVSAPSAVTLDGDVTDVSVEASPTGGVFLVSYLRTAEIDAGNDEVSTRTFVEQVVTTPDGRAGTPAVVASGTLEPDDSGLELSDPVLAADPAGRAVLAWTRTEGDSTQIRSAIGSPAAGVSGNTLTIAAADAPEVAAGPNGTLAVGALGLVTAAVSVAPAGQAFPAAPEPVGAAATSQSLAVLPDGAVLVVTTARGAMPEGRVRAPGGGFGASFPITTEGVFGDVDLDGDGAGHVVTGYTAATGSRGRLLAYDAAPPSLDAFALPGAPAAGAPTSFVTGARDAWSTVGVRWTFGDGGSADGQSVQHTYRDAGDFTVTAAATDAAGNAASRSGSVRVTAVSAAPAEPAAPTAPPPAPAPTPAADPVPPPAAPAPDTTAPVLSGEALSRTLFRVAAGRTMFARAAIARGSRLRFTTDEAGQMRVSIYRLKTVSGPPKRCGDTRRLAAGGGRLLVGRLTQSVVAGRVELPLAGRIGTSALPRGRYEAVVIVSDAARNASRGVRLRFSLC